MNSRPHLTRIFKPSIAAPVLLIASFLILFSSSFAAPSNATQAKGSSAFGSDRRNLIAALRKAREITAGDIIVHVSHTCNLLIGKDSYPVVDVRQLIPEASSPHGLNRVVILDRLLHIQQTFRYIDQRPLFCSQNKLYLTRALSVNQVGFGGNVLIFSTAEGQPDYQTIDLNDAPSNVNQATDSSEFGSDRRNLIAALTTAGVIRAGDITVHVSHTCNLRIGKDSYPVADVRQLIPGASSPHGLNRVVIFDHLLHIQQTFLYMDGRLLFCSQNKLYLTRPLSVNQVGDGGNVLIFSSAKGQPDYQTIDLNNIRFYSIE
jgi:hypothetical protein